MLITKNTTFKKEVLDITEDINTLVKKIKIGKGLCHVFIKHSTCALTILDLDPGSDKDYLDFLDSLIPKIKFRHPHDPDHFPDHFFSSLIGTSLILPIESFKISLGDWQRIALIELNGPRKRYLKVSFIKL